MHSVHPEFEIRSLIYGLPITPLRISSGRISSPPSRSPRTSRSLPRSAPLNAGRVRNIFSQAIRLLPAAIRKAASFLFVGKAAEKEMMDAVRDLTTDYPDTVFYCKRLTRDEIKSLMSQCQCLVCASRDDPMAHLRHRGPVFGKARHRFRSHTGTAGLVTEGVDGFVYRDDEPRTAGQGSGMGHHPPEQLPPCSPPAAPSTSGIIPSRLSPTP